MDRIKDAQIIRLIDQISEYYRTNISNRFLRPLLLQLSIDKSTWDQIDLITEKVELFRYQGYHFDELYRQIAACARFVEAARNGIIPTLKNKLASAPGGPDKILRDMAASNFGSNLQVFADLVYQLYLNLVDMDKNTATKGRMPVYTQMPELSNIDNLLAGK